MASNAQRSACLCLSPCPAPSPFEQGLKYANWLQTCCVTGVEMWLSSCEGLLLLQRIWIQFCHSHSISWPSGEPDNLFWAPHALHNCSCVIHRHTCMHNTHTHKIKINLRHKTKLCIQGCPWTPHPLECWDHRHMLPCLVSFASSFLGWSWTCDPPILVFQVIPLQAYTTPILATSLRCSDWPGIWVPVILLSQASKKLELEVCIILHSVPLIFILGGGCLFGF